MDDHLNMQGQIELEIIHEDGSKEIIKTKNLVVNQGKDNLGTIMLGNSTSGLIPQLIAFGTDGTVTTSTQTSLNASIGSTYLATKSEANQVVVYTFTAPSGLFDNTWQELGLLCGPGTSLFCRATIPPLTKLLTDTINGIWRITF